MSHRHVPALPGLHRFGFTAATLRDLDAELQALNTTRELQREAGSSALPEVKRTAGSSALAQDVFARLHHILFAHGLLPLSEWGRQRVPSGWGVTDWRQHRNRVVLQRIGLSAYLRSVAAAHVRTGSRCLGWDDDEEYTRLLPGCEGWGFSFREKRRLELDAPARRVRGDLCVAQAALPPAATFEVILCASVFEHLACPQLAAYNLQRPLLDRESHDISRSVKTGRINTP